MMGIASFTSDKETVRAEFKSLKNIFDRCRDQYFYHEESFCELSMGMSGDYVIAIEEGSTMIRVGSLLFGERTNAV